MRWGFDIVEREWIRIGIDISKILRGVPRLLVKVLIVVEVCRILWHLIMVVWKISSGFIWDVIVLLTVEEIGHEIVEIPLIGLVSVVVLLHIVLECHLHVGVLI